MNSRTEQSNSKLFQNTLQSKTDDIAICKQLGFSTNLIFSEDEYHQYHPCEDQNFYCKYDNSSFIYAIFDGHEVTRIATFPMQKMCTEIILAQINIKTIDKEIKKVLRQEFITLKAIEHGYNDFIRDLLADRTNLQFDIPDGLNSYEAYQKCPELVEKLNALNCELPSEISAVMVLIYKRKLCAASVGDNIALLCKTDSNQVLNVIQLSINHDLRNKNELLQLFELGLDINSIKQGSYLGNQENTQCISKYLIIIYKEFEKLSFANTKPIISKPEIHGGIILYQSCKFLLIMSQGLYKSLEEATYIEQVNKELALMVFEQFKVQSSLTEVVQEIVNKILRIHHDVNIINVGNSQISKINGNYRVLKENSTSTTDTTLTKMYKKFSKKKNARIKSYVDFSEYYINAEKRRKEGTLPEEIEFQT